MIYLTIQDLIPHIPLYKIAACVDIPVSQFNTGSTSIILDDLERHSISECAIYLSNYYDFQKLISGSTQYQSFNLILLDIFKFNLYSRVDYDKVPSGVAFNYTKAIKTLQQIADRTIAPDWPVKNNEYDGSSITIDCSNVKINYQY